MSVRKPLWRRPYEGWLAIAARFGHVQTLVILAIFYALIIGPLSLGATLTRSDLLAKRDLRKRGSAWREAERGEPTLTRVRQQF
jgi:hypothetical protein